MKHFTINFQPDNRSIVIHSGATLLEAAGRAGIILNSVCGGRGTCGKCVVLLEPEGRQVPACQYHVTSDLTVRIPASSRYFKEQILTEGVEAEVNVEADIYKRYIDAAGQGPILGVAVDIGTTTVVASLVDMRTCGVLGAAAQSNPQGRYGADVVSRISHAATYEGLAELHDLVIQCLNDLIGQQSYGTGTVRITSNYLQDVRKVASYWVCEDCGEPEWCGCADVDRDGVVNFADLAVTGSCCIEITAK